jgi:uncharacterized cupredoxin-like copper-binding protein
MPWLMSLATLLAAEFVMAADHDGHAIRAGQLQLKKKSRVVEMAFGREGEVRKVKRVVRVDMSDAMRYFPDQIRVKRGDTVRFIVHNSGNLPHEMVLGTMEDLKKHAALMKQNDEHDHDDANATQVEPGANGRIVWQFTKAGEFYYGCLVPGHFDAGMIGTIVVR